MQLTLTAALLLLKPPGMGGPGPNKSADKFPSDVASIWFEQLHNVVKAERTTPPPASRFYGITAVALRSRLTEAT